MSDNGPYTQPPQYPSGEGNPGGQPGPYGGSYGPQGGQPDPNTGGQPSYHSGPYQAPYGDGGSGGQQAMGYGSGPYPSQGGMPQYPNQPPYPPQYHAQTPQQPRKNNAGLWIVIAGGVVIVVLVIAVIVVLFNRGGNDRAPVADTPQTTEQTEDTGQTDAPDDDTGDDTGGNTGPSGGPPYSPPEDPCSVLSEGTLEEFGASSSRKNITDNSATCSWSTEVDGLYGTLTVEYSTPYGGSDSVEAAKDDYAFNYDYATDEEGSIFDLEVIEEQELNYGSESVLIFASEEIISPGNRTTVLIRQDNINISVEWSVSNFNSNEPPQSFDDVEEIMKKAAEEALNSL